MYDGSESKPFCFVRRGRRYTLGHPLRVSFGREGRRGFLASPSWGPYERYFIAYGHSPEAALSSLLDKIDFAYRALVDGTVRTLTERGNKKRNALQFFIVEAKELDK